MTNPRADKALNRLLADPKKGGGGFSLRASLANKDFTNGYLVSHGAYEHKIPTRKMKNSPAIIEGYRDAHRKAMGPSDYVGGWRNDDDGYTYLDISRWFRTKEEAQAYAEEQGQIAFYGVKEQDSLPTTLTQEAADAIKARLRQDVGFENKNAVRVPHAEPLKGLPEKGTISQEANALATAYSRKAGIPYKRPTDYRKVDEARAKRIADAFEHMPDALAADADPEYKATVLRSYRKFVQETASQYDTITQGGYTFEFMPSGADPYDGSPWAAMRDLHDNKHEPQQRPVEKHRYRD